MLMDWFANIPAINLQAMSLKNAFKNQIFIKSKTLYTKL